MTESLIGVSRFSVALADSDSQITLTAAFSGTTDSDATYDLTDDGHCTHCGTRLAGVFAGPAGGWGRRRRLVTIGGDG